MTREEALKVLDTIPTIGDQVDALEMAIKALENENALLDRVKVHEIKIYESYADAVLSGEKNFEIRYNDRGYQKGDRLKFQVVEDGSSFHVLFHDLDEKEYEITYVHSGLGMAENYVALAIRAVKEEKE